MTETMFPLERLDEVRANPSDFGLLQRVPLTRAGVTFPYALGEPVGDEVPLVVLDLETTGLDAATDAIIELGMARVQVSPSTGQVTSVDDVVSLYEDPGVPIPAESMAVHGITDDMVAGKRIDDAVVEQWLADDPVVVAHNATFDRPFFEARWPSLAGKRWACSLRGIKWSALGFESGKLEYLVFRNGYYFYEGHRASIDCLAVAWLLHMNPQALQALLASEAAQQYAIKAVGAPFEVKDNLKDRGYQWKPEVWGKVWRTLITEDDLEEEKAFLASLYHRGDQRADIQAIDSRTRFL
ncbi:MAG: DNA polymerase III subunit epsilon [Marinobacter sp. T13-3]|nr:MAG: DNA polymerase III subunit epsilon [Marinobacter sp. T13-3]